MIPNSETRVSSSNNFLRFLRGYKCTSPYNFVGLGELPDAPIVDYLARSLSAFYAIVSAITLFISFDIRHYRSFVKLWAVLTIVTGFVLLGIDLGAEMPTIWTLGEGPPTIAVGLLVMFLQPAIQVKSENHREP